MQKGDAVVHTAIRVLHDGLHSAETELHSAADLARSLRSEAERARDAARRAVFGPAAHESVLLLTSPAPQHDNNKVRTAMQHADRTVQPVLDSLTWWRVLWTPDDASWRIRQAIRDAWVANITSGLLPALAALPSTQARLADTARSTCSVDLPPSLRSRVLLNALDQRAHVPSFVIEPRALLVPLEKRIKRLSDGSTVALARAAQVLLLRVGASIGAGATSAMLLLQGGLGEAVGAGMLVGVVGVRWAVGRWERARRAWREDWVRVKEAAERDVQVRVKHTLLPDATHSNVRRLHWTRRSKRRFLVFRCMQQRALKRLSRNAKTKLGRCGGTSTSFLTLKTVQIYIRRACGTFLEYDPFYTGVIMY